MNSFHGVGWFVVEFVLFVVAIKLLVTGSIGACPVGLMPAGIQKSALLVNVFFLSAAPVSASEKLALRAHSKRVDTYSPDS